MHGHSANYSFNVLQEIFDELKLKLKIYSHCYMNFSIIIVNERKGKAIGFFTYSLNYYKVLSVGEIMA